jgi:hypothetical protein
MGAPMRLSFAWGEAQSSLSMTGLLDVA